MTMNYVWMTLTLLKRCEPGRKGLSKPGDVLSRTICPKAGRIWRANFLERLWIWTKVSDFMLANGLNETQQITRVCPGRFFALNSVWIVAASVIAAFDVSLPIVDGKEIKPDIEWEIGLSR
jgi:hypothetical protein